MKNKKATRIISLIVVLVFSWCFNGAASTIAKTGASSSKKASTKGKTVSKSTQSATKKSPSTKNATVGKTNTSKPVTAKKPSVNKPVDNKKTKTSTITSQSPAINNAKKDTNPSGKNNVPSNETKDNTVSESNKNDVKSDKDSSNNSAGDTKDIESASGKPNDALNDNSVSGTGKQVNGKSIDNSASTPQAIDKPENPSATVIGNDVKPDETAVGAGNSQNVSPNQELGIQTGEKGKDSISSTPQAVEKAKDPIKNPNNGDIKPTGKIDEVNNDQIPNVNQESNKQVGEKGKDSNSNNQVNDNSKMEAANSNQGQLSIVADSDDALLKAVETNNKNLQFKDTKLEQCYSKANEIATKLITPGMTEFQKEKAIYDYVVKNISIIQPQAANASSLYSTLLEKTGDSAGCAKTVKLLLNLSGIESSIINGKYNEDDQEISHTWNIVKINGQYYHLDVSADELKNENPDDASGEISYEYFNLSDDAISANHIWEKNDSLKCTNKSADNLSKILNNAGENPDKYVMQGDWIYYVDDSENGNLNKFKIDGSENNVIASEQDPITKIRIVDNEIYYCADYIYKIKTNGAEKVKINLNPIKDITFDHFDLDNNSLYFIDSNSDNEDLFKIFKMDLITGEIKAVTDDYFPITTIFKLYDKSIYFCKTSDSESGLFSISTVDGSQKKIIDGMPVNVNIIDGWIYYKIVYTTPVQDSSGIVTQTKFETHYFKINIDGSGIQEYQQPTVETKHF